MYYPHVYIFIIVFSQLETEQKIRETNSKIRLAKLTNELLKLYVDLHGTKEQREENGSFVYADVER